MASCGETPPNQAESSCIRGLVRKNAGDGGLALNREDDLADVVAGFQTRVGCGSVREREHSQRWLLDRVVSDKRPDMLHQAAADRYLLFDRPGA